MARQVYDAEPATPWSNPEVQWGPHGWQHAETGRPVTVRSPKPLGWQLADESAMPWLFWQQPERPVNCWWARLPARVLAAWRAWAIGPIDGPAFARLPVLP